MDLYKNNTNFLICDIDVHRRQQHLKHAQCISHFSALTSFENRSSHIKQAISRSSLSLDDSITNFFLKHTFLISSSG